MNITAIVIAVLAVAGFAYGLYRHKTKKKEATPPFKPLPIPEPTPEPTPPVVEPPVEEEPPVVVEPIPEPPVEPEPEPEVKNDVYLVEINETEDIVSIEKQVIL